MLARLACRLRASGRSEERHRGPSSLQVAAGRAKLLGAAGSSSHQPTSDYTHQLDRLRRDPSPQRPTPVVTGADNGYKVSAMT